MVVRRVVLLYVGLHDRLEFLGDAIALDDVARCGVVGVRRGQLDRGAHRIVNLRRDAHRLAP